MIFRIIFRRAVALPAAWVAVSAALAGLGRADVTQVVALTNETIVNGDAAHPLYQQTFDVSATGLSGASVTLPGGGDLTLQGHDGDWTWQSGTYPDLGSLQADYPQGTYTLAFQNSGGGGDSVSLAFDPTEPGGMPMLISPAPGATGVSYLSAPTFQWNAVSPADAMALGCQLIFPNGDNVAEVHPYDVGNTQWTPSGTQWDPPNTGLLPDTTYDFQLSMYQKGSADFDQTTDGGDPLTYYGVFGHTAQSEFTTAPAPEPGTAILLLAGALLLPLWWRRQGRRTITLLPAAGRASWR